MTAAAFLAELRALGVGLMPDGDQLYCEAAPGVLIPELVGRIKGHKTALLALLDEEAMRDPVYRWIREHRPDHRIVPSCPVCATPRVEPTQPCGVCRRLAGT